MTEPPRPDDGAAVRRLLGIAVEDEPPLRLKPAELASSGRRLRVRRLSTAAAMVAAAGLTAAVLLTVSVAGRRDARPPAGPSPTPAWTMPVYPTPPGPQPLDKLTPAQERTLIRTTDAVFRQVFRPPRGWAVTRWVSLIDDPGITDLVWNGGAEIGSPGRAGAGDRLAVVLIVLEHTGPGSPPPDCLLSREKVRLPGGRTGTVQRGGDMIRVCDDRRNGLIVSAVVQSGGWPSGDKRSAKLPVTVDELASLASNPRFQWATG